MPRAPLSRKPTFRYRENRPSSTKRGYGYWWSNPERTGWADQLFVRMIQESGNPWCRYCECKAATLLDHVVPPSSKGEPGSPEYERLLRDEGVLALACDDCNRIKGNKPITHPRVLALRPKDAQGNPLPMRPEVLNAHIRGQNCQTSPERTASR